MAAQTRSIQSNKLFRMGRTGYKRNKLINREIAFTILVFLGLLYGFPFYWAINKSSDATFALDVETNASSSEVAKEPLDRSSVRDP